MGAFCLLVELRWWRVCYWQGLSSLVFSRPGQSQGLLYKQPRHWFINWLSQPFPPTALQRRHAQTVTDSTSSYKIDYIIVIKNFLNLEGHQNPISCSKVTTILLKGWILNKWHPIQKPPSSSRMSKSGNVYRNIYETVWMMEIQS